jgi:hypothetical protein
LINKGEAFNFFKQEGLKMKKLILNTLNGTLLLLVTTSSYALEPAKERKTELTLKVLAFIDLQVIRGSCTITPGPEDYKNLGRPCTAPQVNPGNNQPVNLCTAGDLVVNEPGLQSTIDHGFAERSDCLEIEIFTNAKSGADVFVYGIQPAQQQNILRFRRYLCQY